FAQSLTRRRFARHWKSRCFSESLASYSNAKSERAVGASSRTSGCSLISRDNFSAISFSRIELAKAAACSYAASRSPFIARTVRLRPRSGVGQVVALLYLAFASAARSRKAASPASDTSTHFGFGEASASYLS